MTTYMHCRPCFGTNITICLTSFPVGRPNYAPTSYHQHDQIPSAVLSTPRRRRRLEDPITTYASNYYATLPGQMSQRSQPTSLSQAQPSLPPPPSSSSSSRHIYRQSERTGAYCDLYNLLEYPSPPTASVTKSRRRHHSNDMNSRRAHRLTNSTERKRRYPPTSSCKDKKRQDDKFSPPDHYNYPTEKNKKLNEIYQQRSSNKGFFRRVVRNYFCMPSALSNHDYSS